MPEGAVVAVPRVQLRLVLMTYYAAPVTVF